MHHSLPILRTSSRDDLPGLSIKSKISAGSFVYEYSLIDYPVPQKLHKVSMGELLPVEVSCDADCFPIVSF
jgi:hypothetical protein